MTLSVWVRCMLESLDSVIQREVYVTLQGFHVSREAPRNSDIQHLILLLYWFYFNVVSMAVPSLNWYVRGQNVARVWPDMSRL